MADRLQGISFTEADFISMLKDFVSEGDVTKKINVDVKGADQGAKDISKVSDALTKLNSIKTEDITNQLTTITTLLTKRFQGVNLNQFTSKLISAFQDPAKSAADLADIIHNVYTDLTTLASVTNAKSFGGFSESDIRKTIAKQKKVLDLKKQLDVEQTTARTDANAKQKPVDILTKAKTYKIQRKSAIDVGDSLGIDRSTVNVQNNDDALLQTYQRTADVLSKMISERKEYNKLNKTNVSDYLQQEQDILSVFRQLQSIEGQVSEKFQISSENLLSNQFKNNNGQFDFVENARKAVNAYVTQMTSSTQKAFQNAQDELGKHLARSAERSVDRLSNQNEAIGRTSQKLRESKSTASSTAAAQVGTEIGESVAAGMEKAQGATESATSGIEKYLLSAEQTIGKLKELRQTLEDLDTEYLDSDMSDEKIEKKIQDTSTESLRYIANLRRLGYSKQDIDQILGKTLDDENWTSYIDTYAKESNANKDIIKRISTYKDQSIAETPTSLNPTSIEETRSAIEETKSSIEVLLEYLNQLKTQDLGNLSTGFDQLPPKIREAINELGLLNKETDKLNFADTGHTNHGVIVGEQHTLISKNANSEKYAQALQLKDALDQAADAGANVARILDIAFDSSTNTMLQLQQTASGDLISNIPGYGESSDNLKFNEALLEATDEQIIKLINDLETLNSLGINVDFTDSNFLYDKQKGFSIIDLAMKDQGASDYGASDLLEMFGFIRDEFSYAGKDTSAVDSFIERIKTAITLREELQKPGGNTGLLDTTDAEGKINSLKDELASLHEELQHFKDTGVEPEGITELQTKLEGAEQRAESLSSELSHLYENSVDTATYQQLEEELQEAKASAESLKEELTQIRSESEQPQVILPSESDTTSLSSQVNELNDTEQQIQQAAESAASAEGHLAEATAAAAQAGANVSEVASQHQEQAQAAEEAAASEEHLKEATESTAQAGTSASEAAQQHQEQAKAAEEATTAEEHLNETIQESVNADVGAKEAAEAHKQQEEAANAAADAIQESAKAQDSAMQEEVKQTKAAVDELIKSYERLADAEAKATNGSTAVAREKGRTKAEEIKTRQAELETKISGKTTAEQDAQINAAKAYYERLRTAYENDRVRTSKDLGFESGNNVDKTWDTLIDKAQQYENILNKQNNLHKSLTVNESSFLAKYADMYKEAGEKAEEAGEKGKKFNEAIEEAQSLIRSNTIDDFSRKIGDLTAEGDNMPQAYNDQVRELRENLAKLKEIDFDPKGGNWGQLVDSINNGLNKLNTDPFMQKVNELQKETLNRQMSDWANNNSGAGEYLNQVKALQQALQSAASQGDLDNIAAGFEKIKSSAAEAGKTGESFGEGLMKRFKSLGQYLLSFASFYRVIDVFKQAIGVVKELDTALVELKKVSDESTQSYSNFMKNSFDMADDVGTTAQSIISSTADWKRLGESFEEAQKSATTSTVLLNVSEFTNIEDATQSLVSASQAYKDLDKMDIVDKLNNIGNNFSVSTDDLATGLKNAAAVLATQGNDIDQALALLTAGNAVTQDISKTSAGIRTISLRIAGKMLPERMVTYGYVNTY